MELSMRHYLIFAFILYSLACGSQHNQYPSTNSPLLPEDKFVLSCNYIAEVNICDNIYSTANFTIASPQAACVSSNGILGQWSKTSPCPSKNAIAACFVPGKLNGNETTVE